MVTLGNLKNQLDALAQLRRFQPDSPVLCNGAPVVSLSVDPSGLLLLETDRNAVETQASVQEGVSQ